MLLACGMRDVSDRGVLVQHRQLACFFTITCFFSTWIMLHRRDFGTCKVKGVLADHTNFYASNLLKSQLQTVLVWIPEAFPEKTT